jgi:plastocyanin
VTIAVGETVNFINKDTRPHDFVGGLDPANPDCPEIVIAGFLTPGQSRQTGIFTSARTCDFHDHTQMGVPEFTGRIIIR